MQKVLFKRVSRNLVKNLPRYLALMFLIVVSLFVVISFAASADTVISGIEKISKEDNVEDGEFTMFMPLSQNEKDLIKEKGVELEPMFYMDYLLDENSDKESTIRVFRNRQNINLLRLCDGNYPVLENEVVLERRYADVHNLKVNDTITVANKKLTIVGIGTTGDYEATLKTMGDTAVNSNTFGIGFLSNDGYNSLMEIGGVRAQEYVYGYVLPEDSSFSGFDLKDLLQESPSSNFGLVQFVEAKNNPRINCATDDALINKNSALFLGVIVMLLLAYIFAVFITHEIEKDNTVIGTLYSLGVTRKDLLFHYLQLPLVVTFIGGLIGLFVGMSDFACDLMLVSTVSYYSVPNLELVKPPLLILYATVLPPLMALIVNILVINKKLNRPALSLLKNEQKSHKVSTFKLSGKHKDNKKNFIRRFRIRQLVREYRSALTVVFGILISYVILCMGINCYTFCHNINVKNTEDVCFNYMYTYKYPETAVPENSTPICAKTLSKEINGFTMDLQLLGINQENPFFDLVLSNNSKDVVISDSVATRFNLKIGDDFTLDDETNKESYDFKVKDIIKYSAGFYVFLDIDEMRDLMEVEDNFFNMVISNEKLDIPSEKLYNTLTKEDIIKSSEIFLNLMKSLVYTLLGSSVMIFVFVMYLMMKVMIDRSSKNISLFRIFGFKSKEIKKLYLDGNFFVVALGSLISLPLAKLIMDFAYPRFLVANVAAGVYLSYHWWTYIVIYALTLILYFIINNSLVRHINKISLVEILRNRE